MCIRMNMGVATLEEKVAFSMFGLEFELEACSIMWETWAAKPDIIN